MTQTKELLLVILIILAGYASASCARRKPENTSPTIVTVSSATLSVSKDAVQSESIYDRLGLMPGDTITLINGEEIKTPDEATSKLESLSAARQIINVTYLRNGQTLTLSFGDELEQ